MADETDQDDEEVVLDDEDESPATSTLSQLEARCKSANIPFSRFEDEDIGKSATISLPAGRGKRNITVWNEAGASALLGVEFEQCKFLAGYEAVWWPTQRQVELSIRPTRMDSGFLLRKLRRASGLSDEADIVVSPPAGEVDRPTIKIGNVSSTHQVLVGRIPRITISFTNIRATRHDDVLSEVRSYADSLFFQMDSIFRSSFILARERRRGIARPIKRDAEVSLIYPTAQYNDEAITLYWYAKSARDMPLMQFLAFYQSIEYYFPRYSTTEARRKIAGVIRQPNFRAFRDDDLDRVLSAIKLSHNGGLGSERAQLRTVIHECVNEDELRAFLSHPSRVDHFSDKGSGFKKISTSPKNTDILIEVAERIYDVRCKIVHTKSDHGEEETKMLLPFSDDADNLGPDIDLIQLVARQVLIVSSSELK